MRELRRSPVTRVWLPALALAAATAALDRGADPGDLVYFVHRGEVMLSGAWAGTFASPTLQAGPLQLLLAGACRNTAVLAFVVEIGVAALLLLVLRRLAVPGRWALAAGVVAVAAGLTHGAFVDGHPAEAVSPLLWVLAAAEARRSHAARAGALVGISAGFELWGLLGVAVLLLSARRRDWAAGAAAAGAVTIGLFAPFVLFGSFHMFDYSWRVAPGTLLGLVLGGGASFGWPLRLAQASAACALGGAVAWRTRGSVHGLWLVPLAVVVMRLALDPLAYGWYWLEAEALAIVGAAITLTAPPFRVTAGPLRGSRRPPRAAAQLPRTRS